MKKILSLLCTILISSFLVACNSKEENNSSYAAENGETVEAGLQTIANNDVETDLTNQDEGNADFYNVCTNYSKVEVEDFMLKVQQLVLEKNWEALSEHVSYPISIYIHADTDTEIVVDNKEGFADGSFASVISEAFYTAVAQASPVDMFCSWQGIMLGDGEIWVSEVLNDDRISQGLKIMTFNIR